MKRKAPEASSKPGWEWQGPGGEWKSFSHDDSVLLEKLSAVGDDGKVSTKALSFAKGTTYDIDFGKSQQINTSTGKARKIRKVVADSTASSAAADEKDSKCAKSVWSGDSKIPDAPPLSVEKIKHQASLGAQSKRGMPGPPKFGPAIKGSTHAKHCFEKMLENERRLSGEWATFYHSYNNAALIYEVQAAIAAVLFRFKSTYAPLPRLMRGCFSEIPDAPSMMKEFPSWPDQDHNPRFKSVGICASTSLLGDDPEASPKNCFMAGYAASSISLTVVENLLTDCGIDMKTAQKMARQILELAEKFGLSVAAFGHKHSKSGLAGHLLQIFIKRNLVDKYVYSSHPMGVPDPKRHPIGEHLLTCGPSGGIRGQVRIVVHPLAFLQASKVRMFVYSADEDFHKGRSTFQELTTALLSPVLGTPAARTNAAKGIFGGALPVWFKADDQRETTKAAPKRLSTSDWK